jgi:hypothetical protein
VLPWWGWVLLWGVLVVGGAAWVGLRSRSTWRSAKALSVEVSRTGELLAELEARADELREVLPEHSAVTQDPHGVRDEYRTVRAATRAERQARRAARRPPWARVD